MKNITSRILSIILCLAMIMPLLIGCSTHKPTFNWGNGGTPVVFDPVIQTSGGITLQAEGAENGVISTLSVFKITTENDMTEEELAASLTVTPQINLSIKKTGEKTFDMTPAKELEEGTLYRFTVGEKDNPTGSFVFQTESDLIIKSVFPADKSVDVPVNTGIEITFSEPLSPDTDFSKYITNDKNVKGYFDLYPNGRTLVFVPEKELKKGTVYTFTVKENIPSVSGKALSEGREFKFVTQTETDYESSAISLTSTMLLFSRAAAQSGAEIDYRLYTRSQSSSDNKIDLTLYSFDSAEKAAKAIIDLEKDKENYIFNSSTPQFSTKGLKKVSEIKINGENTVSSKYSYNMTLTLPSLEGGIYLAEMVFTGKIGGKRYEEKLQCIIQVSDLIAYTEQSEDQMLVWVNGYGQTDIDGTLTSHYFNRYDCWNAESSTSDGTETYKISNGIATFTTPQSNAAVMIVNGESDSLLLPVSLLNANANGSAMAYLFTDRTVYFSDDKISFSGIVKSLEDKSITEGYYTVGYSEVYYPLAINEDGTFNGEVILEDRSPSYYMPLRIYDNDKNLIAVQYLRITDEEKPVYKMEVSFDRLFYRYGDTATFTARVTFFDGTPAEGLKISLYSDRYTGVNKTLVTDKNGQIKHTFTLGRISSKSTSPVTIGISAELVGEETTSLYRYASATYFHSDLWFECEEIRESSPVTEVRLNKIDTSSILTSSDLWYPAFPDNIIGEPENGVINVTYTKTTYVKTGYTEYDPITKTTRTSYYYNTVQSTLKKETLTLTDGKVSIPHIKKEADFEGYYSCEISYYDSKTKNTYVLYSNITDYGTQPIPDYDARQGYNIRTDKEAYSVGDSVTLTLTNDGKTPEGTTLFTLYSNGRKEYVLSKDGTYTFTYEDGFIPGAKVVVSHFDGTVIQRLGIKQINYDYENNNTAEISLIMDDRAYRPGDQVTLLVKMTKDGQPIKGGYVTLCLVDEACFALGDQKVNPLAQYYTRQYNDNVSRNFLFYPLGSYDLPYGVSADFSTAEDSAMEPGEKLSSNGDESETDIREDFQNNPIFETLYLNGEGEALVTFTLPDNITEWRVTAIGFAERSPLIGGMDVGTAQTGVIASLPFFLNLSLSDLYIEGDDIAFMAQCYGTDLYSKVRYTAEITDHTGRTVREKHISEEPVTRAHFNLGKLDVGSYFLTVTAEADGYSDGVKMPFTVVRSATVMTAYRNMDISDISRISPALYPVSLTFYDREYDKLFEAAAMIRRHYGTRADSNAAHYLVTSILGKIFGEGVYTEKERKEIKASLSSYKGFIPLMTYGQEDVELTAKIAAVVPDVFTAEAKERLIVYTEDYLNSCKYTSPEEMTAALLLLSGLGSGNLADLYYARAQLEDYGIKPTLYLAAAFGYMGDWTTCKEIINDLISDYGEESDGELRIRGKNTEESIEYTALALMAASLTDGETADKLAAYLKTHTSTVDLYSLETAAYFKTLIPEGEGENSLIYRVNGEEHTVSMSKRGSVSLTLTKDEFENLEIISASETLGVRAIYKAAVDEAIEGGLVSDTVTLKKTVTPYDETRGLYKVTISYTVETDRNSEYFVLTDTIPAGARFFRSFGTDSNNGKTFGSYAHLSNSGQTMTGAIGTWNSTENLLGGLTRKTYTGSVSYLIRGAVKGEFICEAAVAINNSNGSYAVSERGTFTVE